MQIYHLDLTAEECATIVGALSNHPYRQVAPLIDKIKRQCDAQDRHLEEKVKAEKLQREIDHAVEAALDGIGG